MKDLTGLQVGRWTVRGFARNNNNGQRLWLCRCECGNEKEVAGYSLTTNKSRSCGCAHRDYMKQALGSSIGALTGAKWSVICHNAKTRGHQIQISQEYAANLFDRQMGRCALSGAQLTLDAPRPQITASLDRIDNKLGYVEGNVQWIHKDVNKMKTDLSQDIFVGWANRIATHRARQIY